VSTGARQVVARTSLLAASAEAVWGRVTTPAGVNYELGPWLRMTVPRQWRDSSLDDIPAGTHVGKSWVLLLGVIPFDYDDLSIAESGPGRFVERSTMASMHFWQHERTVVDAPGGCELRDTLTFETRGWVPAAVGRRIVAAIFGHRHRRLHRTFGTVGTLGV
jgi:ligand-binding SRPBCC domain-containing protein